MKIKDIANGLNIIIPKAQRDYTLGSYTYKLLSFYHHLSNLEESNGNLSTFIGYKEGNDIYVFDGQQRIISILILLHAKGYNSEILSKLRFEDEDKQEQLQAILCGKEIPKNYTGKSLKSAIWEASSYYIDTEQLDFLYNQVEFDFKFGDKLTDMEQLLIEFNDGLKVEPYEIYKAKLISIKGIPDDLLDKRYLSCMYRLNGITKGKSYNGINLKPLSYTEMSRSKIIEAEKALVYLVKYIVSILNTNKLSNEIEDLSFETEHLISVLDNIFNVEYTPESYQGLVICGKFNMTIFDSNPAYYARALLYAHINSGVEYSNNNVLIYNLIAFLFTGCESSLSKLRREMQININKSIAYGGATKGRNSYTLASCYNYSKYLCREILENLYGIIQPDPVHSIYYEQVDSYLTKKDISKESYNEYDNYLEMACKTLADKYNIDSDINFKFPDHMVEILLNERINLLLCDYARVYCPRYTTADLKVYSDKNNKLLFKTGSELFVSKLPEKLMIFLRECELVYDFDNIVFTEYRLETSKTTDSNSNNLPQLDSGVILVWNVLEMVRNYLSTFTDNGERGSITTTVDIRDKATKVLITKLFSSKNNRFIPGCTNLNQVISLFYDEYNNVKVRTRVITKSGEYGVNRSPSLDKYLYKEDLDK